MSTATPAKPKKKTTKPAGMPDERFWIKYSPNHELPLSVTSSVFIHALALGFVALVLAGFLSGLFSKPQPKVEAFAIGGGSGDPNGSSEAPGEAAIPTGPEINKKSSVPEPVKPLEAKDLKVPTPTTEPLVKPSEGPTRLVEESLSHQNLTDVAKKASAQLELAAAAAKGKGGRGTGGGLGEGTGTGTGNNSGPGGGTLSQERARRNLRWTMIFRTYSGPDYLNQLRDLGATLAIPEGSGEYLVFRDLGKRPIGKKEPEGSLTGIRWIDDRADSVPALAMSLGLRTRPPYVVAYFPTKLEIELRQLEKQRFSGEEDLIDETVFRVTKKGGKYVPEVQDLRHH